MATADDSAYVDVASRRNSVWSGVRRFARRNILGTAGALVGQIFFNKRPSFVQQNDFTYRGLGFPTCKKQNDKEEYNFHIFLIYIVLF
jgi:hypothetical protein